VTELLDAVASTSAALHLPGRPEWSPIFGLLVLYSSLAATAALGHVGAAFLGDRRFSAIRITRAERAVAVGLVFLGLALIAAGLPLGEFL
jgi:hypothetical protein